jgi:putative component of toxin-antitoxin plasmid stabilization module
MFGAVPHSSNSLTASTGFWRFSGVREHYHAEMTRIYATANTPKELVEQTEVASKTFESSINPFMKSEIHSRLAVGDATVLSPHLPMLGAEWKLLLEFLGTNKEILSGIIKKNNILLSEVIRRAIIERDVAARAIIEDCLMFEADSLPSELAQATMRYARGKAKKVTVGKAITQPIFGARTTEATIEFLPESLGHGVLWGLTLGAHCSTMEMYRQLGTAMARVGTGRQELEIRFIAEGSHFEDGLYLDGPLGDAARKVATDVAILVFHAALLAHIHRELDLPINAAELRSFLGSSMGKRWDIFDTQKFRNIVLLNELLTDHPDRVSLFKRLSISKDPVKAFRALSLKPADSDSALSASGPVMKPLQPETSHKLALRARLGYLLSTYTGINPTSQNLFESTRQITSLVMKGLLDEGEITQRLLRGDTAQQIIEGGRHRSNARNILQSIEKGEPLNTELPTREQAPLAEYSILANNNAHYELISLPTSIQERILRRLEMTGINFALADPITSSAFQVWKVSVDSGPGYRAYFRRINPTTIAILAVGKKDSQELDIKRADNRWSDPAIHLI